MITIKLILITVVLVLGLKIAMSEGMLLERVGKYFELKIEEGHKWMDLFFCQWCMSTLQSIVAYFFAFGLNVIPFEWNWQLLIRWPLVVMGGSIIAGNIWNLYLAVNQIKDKNEIEYEYIRKKICDEQEDIENNNKN